MEMQETIGQAKADFQQAKEHLVRLFQATPDDRMDWSPTPTARTPVQLVAHAAFSIMHLNNMFEGRMFAGKNSEEADRIHRADEAPYTTREQALALLDKHSDAYVAWLDALTEERYESMVKLPFDLGQVPQKIAMKFPADHTRWHAAQMDYLQTIYGDRVWH